MTNLSLFKIYQHCNSGSPVHASARTGCEPTTWRDTSCAAAEDGGAQHSEPGKSQFTKRNMSRAGSTPSLHPAAITFYVLSGSAFGRRKASSP